MGRPGNRVQPPNPKVRGWVGALGRTSEISAFAHAFSAVMPPTLAQYTSLSTSGSFQRSHIAIVLSPSYRARIAFVASTCLRYSGELVSKNVLSFWVAKWPSTGTT